MLRETALQVLHGSLCLGPQTVPLHPTAPLGMVTATPADASIPGSSPEEGHSWVTMAVAVHTGEAAEAPVPVFLSSGFGH